MVPPLFRRVALVALVIAASWFYVAAATEHGRRVNEIKSRGDQSGYLWDAENVYHNWHGREPRALIGERNRMPLYAGYLALFYHDGLSDPDYFIVAKQANIYLSLALLAVIAVIAWKTLPGLVAVNFVGIVAFGIFVFKAGYSQSELLFSGLFFLAFLGVWRLFQIEAGKAALGLAVLTGAAAGLAYMTKAAVPPFLVVLSGVYGLAAADEWRRSRDDRKLTRLAWRVGTVLLVLATFCAVVSPYLATNKRVFGRYFYNVNSTFYVWYDNWPSASVGTRLHGDSIGWPTMPAAELPSASRYWREHTVRQIVDRLASGFANMAEVSYRTYEYLPYLVLFVGTIGVLALRRGRTLAAMIRAHAWLVLFLAAYAAAYLVAIAFYFPISGTGTARFLIPHLLPLFFVLSRALASRRWLPPSIAPDRRVLPLAWFHYAVTIVLGLDVLFRLWPRLMTTYGGF